MNTSLWTLARLPGKSKSSALTVMQKIQDQDEDQSLGCQDHK